jgi:endonuclease/exonuclease/phosphatase family metal-dependent hydrolase
MRLVTWNCCHGNLAPKRAATRALRPDVLVLQECARDRKDSHVYRWFGDDPNKKGVAVVCADGWKLEPAPRARGVPRWTIPVRVSGPANFLLFAVWTKSHRKHPYIEALHRALDRYAKLLDGGPTVVMGDFNANSIWDHDHEAHRSHSAAVRRLNELGVASAYHTFFQETHGTETRNTYYFLWNERAAYHVDYCFVPRAWKIGGVTIGSNADFRRLSDHRPLIVDIADTHSRPA